MCDDVVSWHSIGLAWIILANFIQCNSEIDSTEWESRASMPAPRMFKLLGSLEAYTN